MNRLDVLCERKINEVGGPYYAVDFLIDGRRLIDLIHEFEASFAGDLAGAYSHNYFGEYTEEFLLGLQPEYGESGDKTELLGCTCGCRGCWPLAVRIKQDGTRVVWEAFEQPHRTWSYDKFGPFVFELNQYRHAIAQIPKA